MHTFKIDLATFYLLRSELEEKRTIMEYAKWVTLGFLVGFVAITVLMYNIVL